jgi:16S rRNA (guanine527-N7)-methyltransferase
MLDATEKRIRFIENALALLDIGNVRCIAGRAEEYAKRDAFREKFDLAVSRAVANLPVLTELCLGFVKPGGFFLALKGQKGRRGSIRSQNAIREMGGKLLRIFTCKDLWNKLYPRYRDHRKNRSHAGKNPRRSGRFQSCLISCGKSGGPTAAAFM